MPDSKPAPLPKTEISRGFPAAVAFLVFAALSVLAYWPIRHVSFLSDDYVALTLMATQGWYWSWGDAAHQFFRPLSVFFHWLDFRIWHLNPEPYHVINMLWHGLCATGVAGLTYRLLRDPGRPRETFWPALAAGLLFVFLPSHTEAVTFISSNELVTTAFALLSVNAALLYLEGRGLGWYGLAMVGMLASLLAKESAVVLLPVFVLLGGGAVLSGRRSAEELRRFLGLLAGAGLVMGFYFGLRFAVLKAWVGAYDLQPGWWWPDLSGPRMGRALLRLWMPPFSPAGALWWGRWPADAVFAIILALTGLLVWGVRRTAQTGSGVSGWYLAGLPICCGLALYPVLLWDLRLDSLAGERWLYLPTAFAVVWLTILLLRLLPRRRAWGATLAVILAAAGVGLVTAERTWVEAGRMAERTLASASGQVTRDRLVVLNLPAELSGAYVFWMGFTPALLISERARLYERFVLSAVALPAGDDPGLTAAALMLWRDKGMMSAPETILKAQAECARLPAHARSESVEARRQLDLLLQISRLVHIQTVVFMTCRSPEDRVTVRNRPEGIELTLETPGTTFIRMAAPVGWQVDWEGTRQAVIRSTTGVPPADADILYWDGGGFRRWTP